MAKRPDLMRRLRENTFRGWYCLPHDQNGCRCAHGGNSMKYSRARDRRDAERLASLLADRD